MQQLQQYTVEYTDVFPCCSICVIQNDHVLQKPAHTLKRNCDCPMLTTLSCCLRLDEPCPCLVGCGRGSGPRRAEGAAAWAPAPRTAPADRACSREEWTICSWRRGGTCPSRRGTCVRCTRTRWGSPAWTARDKDTRLTTWITCNMLSELHCDVKSWFVGGGNAAAVARIFSIHTKNAQKNNSWQPNYIWWIT